MPIYVAFQTPGIQGNLTVSDDSAVEVRRRLGVGREEGTLPVDCEIAGYRSSKGLQRIFREGLAQKKEDRIIGAECIYEPFANIVSIEARSEEDLVRVLDAIGVPGELWEQRKTSSVRE